MLHTRHDKEPDGSIEKAGPFVSGFFSSHIIYTVAINSAENDVKPLYISGSYVITNMARRSFFSSFRCVENNDANLYLQRISPSSYPKLFGEALESGILMTVLGVFKEFYIP